MNKYINAYELLKRWNIRSIQLFNLCKKGDLQQVVMKSAVSTSPDAVNVKSFR